MKKNKLEPNVTTLTYFINIEKIYLHSILKEI